MADCLGVVIATHRRPAWLKRCLLSLDAAAEAAGVRLKIEVGVNGDDPESARLVVDLKTELRATLTVTCFEAMSPAAARNRLLGSVDSEWVLFIDDDAFVDDSFFKEFAKVRREFGAADAIGGPNLTPPGSTSFQRASGAALASRFATFVSYARYRALRFERPCGEESLILCNLFVRRAALGKAPFPEGFVCNEENWLLQRMTAEGRQLIYAPGLWVWHERRAEFGAFALQAYRYGCGRGQHIRRRPGSLRVAHVLPSLCILYLLAAIVSLGRDGSVGFALTPLAAYVLLALAAAAVALARAKESVSLYLIVCMIFPIVHLSYGVGLLRGLAK